MNGDSFVKTPGLLGDYSQSCVACLTGTDTALAVKGPAEAGMALLSVLGLPDDQAQATAEAYFATNFGSAPGQVPEGDITFPVRVCEACCAKSGTGMKPGLIAAGIPVYQPSNKEIA